MKRFLTILLCISTIFYSGCIAEKQILKDSEKPSIVYSIDKVPDDLIVLNRRNESEEEMLSALFEGLVSKDKFGEIIPAIAESWDISEDQIEYTFNIRADAKWSDGSEILASDFVVFFTNILSKKVDNIFFSQLNCIYGVEDYHSGRIKANGLGIRAKDDKTLVFRLNYPSSDLLKVLSTPIYGLRNDVNKLVNWKINYSNIKYSGAFQISSVVEKGEISLERNNYYWNKEEVTDSKFTVIEKSSKEAALAEYETNRIDIVTNPPISEIKRLIESEDTVIMNTPNKIGITFNFSEKSIGSEINFRKAVDEIIDAEDIADKALSEFTISNSDSSEDSINAFKDTAVSNSNSTIKANEYLRLVSSDKLKNIRLIALNTDKNKKISNEIKEKIETQLTASVKVDLLESYELSETIKNKNFDMLITTYPVDYDEDVSELERFTSKSIDNYGKYSNTNFDTGFSKLELETDDNKRLAIINECNNILNADISVIYLFNDVKVIAKTSDLSGLDTNVYGHLDFRSIHRNK